MDWDIILIDSDGQAWLFDRVFTSADPDGFEAADCFDTIGWLLDDGHGGFDSPDQIFSWALVPTGGQAVLPGPDGSRQLLDTAVMLPG